MVDKKPKELKALYLVARQFEGLIEPPKVFYLEESGIAEADKLAADATFQNGDVRVFELDLATLRAREVYVPQLTEVSDEPIDEGESEEE